MILSEKTSISLGLLGLIIGALVPSIFWISSLSSETHANAMAIAEYKTELQNINAQLSEIKGYLNKMGRADDDQQ